jgi:hypothetical protein
MPPCLAALRRSMRSPKELALPAEIDPAPNPRLLRRWPLSNSLIATLPYAVDLRKAQLWVLVRFRQAGLSRGRFSSLRFGLRLAGTSESRLFLPTMLTLAACVVLGGGFLPRPQIVTDGLFARIEVLKTTAITCCPCLHGCQYPRLKLALASVPVLLVWRKCHSRLRSLTTTKDAFDCASRHRNTLGAGRENPHQDRSFAPSAATSDKSAR